MKFEDLLGNLYFRYQRPSNLEPGKRIINVYGEKKRVCA
jgi:hypothetical protein